KNSDFIRRLCHEVNIVPDVKDVQIPIIPGITIYSYLRFFNAYSSIPKIDVYVNGKKVVSNLNYKCFTKYDKIFPGYYRIQIFEAGKTNNPILTTSIHMIGYLIYTAAITGLCNRGFLELVNDRVFPIPQDNAAMRLIQLSPSAPLMDAFLDDTLILTEIDFGEVSRYCLTPSKIHDLKLRDYIKHSLVVEAENIMLHELCAYTAYVIGNFDSPVGIELVVELEGICYLNF
ncbi:MAG: DUF4397 domain-containing protein, partial [Anaerotignum sp.]|nr:DUF4397 domain-containing protein [Anaerotignum sp.]